MDLQTIFNNAAQARRHEELKSSPQLLLGELILKLESIADKTKKVQFDFEYARPDGLDSWRGIYAELSICFKFEGEYPTVQSFLDELKGAIGKTYVGYKGGDFVMGKNTPLWVANYGNSGRTAVVEVIDDYSVILETKYINS